MKLTIKELNKELEVLNLELEFSENLLKQHDDKRTINYINQDIERKKKEISDWEILIKTQKEKLKRVKK